MSKAIMFCGRDESGVVRPVSVNTEGAVKIDGGTGSGMQYSYVEDDNGQPVLRVVDAAPYLVEYGMYNTLTSKAHDITTSPAKVVDENAERKYLSIYNNGDGFISLSAGDVGSEAGIVIAPHERYEMCVARGNLYRGAMHLCALDAKMKIQTVTDFVQGGIGNSGFSDSLIRTHTDYIPVSVPESGLSVSVSVDSSVVAIRNVASFDANHNLVYYDIAMGMKFPVQDGVYTNGGFTITNPAVAYIAVSFCNAADATSNISPDDMSDTVLTIKQMASSTAYIAEGE